MREVIIIADASCLIALTNIKALWILESVYRKVYITQTILDEYELPIPDFIENHKAGRVRVVIQPRLGEPGATPAAPSSIPAPGGKPALPLGAAAPAPTR